jgi:APA family basic amino acid/polyamine antiporter
VAVAIAAGLTPISVLGDLVSIGTLMAFVIVSLGIVFLRRNRPDLKAAFRTPMVPFVPILSALVSLALMYGLSIETWLRLFIWMAIGLVIYFAYGYKHSELRKSGN